MILDQIIKDYTGISPDIVLDHFRCKKASKQYEEKYFFYSCPFCKDSGTPHFLVSRGLRRGGIYEGIEWKCTARKIRGYGAVELVRHLYGLPKGTEGLRRSLEILSQIVGATCADIAEENRYGFRSLVPAQKSPSYELMVDFTEEGLRSLGCLTERVYETVNGRRFPLHKDGVGDVYRHSFGTWWQYVRQDRNFDLARLREDFGLYQIRSFTTASFMRKGEEMSEKIISSELFPMFVLDNTLHEDNGKKWSRVLMPCGKEGRRGCFVGTLPETFHGLMGDKVFNIFASGRSVLQAIVEGKTEEPYIKMKTRMVENENGKMVEEEVQMDDEEIRVENVIVCRSATDAIAAYYHLNAVRQTYSLNPSYSDLFFHVVWPADDTGDFRPAMYRMLRKFARNIFTMFPIDAKGKKQAFLIGKRYRDIRLCFLPPERNFGVSVCDFFRNCRLTEEEGFDFDKDLNLLLLSCLTAALSTDPLEYQEKRDKKTWKVLDYWYRVDCARLWQFMASEGFCRDVDPESSNRIGRFVQITPPFVSELDAENLVATTTEKLKDFAQRIARPGTDDFQRMCNAIILSKEVNEKAIVNLPRVSVDYKSGYGPAVDHFFYRNGAIRITPDKISFVSYEDLEFNVDRAEVLPFDFIMPPDADGQSFRIYESEEYVERTRQLEKHVKDTEHYSLQDINKEREDLMELSQTKRWRLDFFDRKEEDRWPILRVLRCFANEDWEKEMELLRKGSTFSEEQEMEVNGHFANLLYSLGRILYRYRDGQNNYIPYLMENKVSMEGKAEGGSGKSVFVNTIAGCAGKILTIDGRNIKPDGEFALYLQKYIHHCHRVIHWEDLERVPVEQFFNYATSGFQYRRLFKDIVTVRLDESPGHVISSNISPQRTDDSVMGRLVMTGFSHRFCRSNEQKNKAARLIDDVMPGFQKYPEKMDVRTRSEIAYVCAKAVQFCMNCKEKVLAPQKDLKYRSMASRLGEKFVKWANIFFSEDFVFRVPIDIDTIFGEYVDFCESAQDKTTKFSLSQFKKRLNEYCESNGIVMNPKVCFRSETDKEKGYMRVKAWCRTAYFDDAKVWGTKAKKIVRELRQSYKCVFFCKKGEEPASQEEVVQICEAYYKRPDPDPVLDADDRPVRLSEEEKQRWEKYCLRKQGLPMNIEKIKTGEAKPEEDLPF